MGGGGVVAAARCDVRSPALPGQEARLPSPQSEDLRQKVVDAVEERGETYEEAADRYEVGRASVSRWLRRLRETGSVAPAAMGGRRRGLGPADVELVGELVKEAPDRTIAELKDAWRSPEVTWAFGSEAAANKETSTGAISRALAKLGLTRKKKSLRASEQDREEVQEQRREFRALQQLLDPSRLVFIDESGSHIAMTRLCARAPEGQRARDAVPRNRGTVITMVGALRMEGLVAMMTIQGGVCSDVFVSYVKQVLVPALQPGDIVVVDNLAAHKDPRVAELLDSVDASLLFLPPYSPDLNPIEECLLLAALADTGWRHDGRTALGQPGGPVRECPSPTSAPAAARQAGARPVTVTVTVTVTAHGPRPTVHGPRPTAHKEDNLMQRRRRNDLHRLDAYRCALELYRLVGRIVACFPRGEAEFKGQMKRAARSVPFNIGEGVGKRGRARAAAYEVALGEAKELIVALDCVEIDGLAPIDEVVAGQDLADRMAAMLTRMIASAESA